MRDEDTKLSPPFHWAANCFLDLKFLPHDGGVQFLLKCEQIHVSL